MPTVPGLTFTPEHAHAHRNADDRRHLRDDLTYRVSDADENGAASDGDSRTFTITVRAAETPEPEPEPEPPKNTAPAVEAGRDQRVTAGDTVTLQGSATDAEDDDLTFAWTQSGGSPTVALRDADRPTAYFVAPEVDSELTFTLAVTDSGGLTGNDTITVRIELGPPPRNPEAGTRLSRPSVRLIYFLPNDRPLRMERVRAFRRLIKDSQEFFAEQMESHGFGRKLFTVESDDNGTPVVYRVDGDYPTSYYETSDTGGNIDFKVWKEVLEQFEDPRHVYFVVIDQRNVDLDGACGLGGMLFVPSGGHPQYLFGSMAARHRDETQGEQGLGGVLLLPAEGPCFEDNRGFLHRLRATTHELGHAWGLEHDFRPSTSGDAAIGGRGFRLSSCDAEWLSVSRFFNPGSSTSHNTPGNIRLISEPTYSPEGVHLRFRVTDADGLHQAQLLVPGVYSDPAWGPYQMLDCKQVGGNEDTVEFVSSALAKEPFVHRITLQVIDAKGGITWTTLPFQSEPPLDETPTAGEAWRQVLSGERGQFLRDVAYGDGRFVAVGATGTIVYSNDGDRWQEAPGSATSADLRGIAFGDGRFVAVGIELPGMVVYSSDGSTWSQASASATSGHLVDVTFGNGRFVRCRRLRHHRVQQRWGLVARGQRRCLLRDVTETSPLGMGASLLLWTEGTIAHSSDGSAWQKVVSSGASWRWYYDVAFGVDRFVAVGDFGTIMHSIDGRTWRQASDGATLGHLLGVTFGAGRFVAVGDRGVVVYSTDGDHWETASNSAIANALWGVAFGGGRFAAVGEDGTVIVSPIGEYSRQHVSCHPRPSLPVSRRAASVLFMDGATRRNRC